MRLSKLPSDEILSFFFISVIIKKTNIKLINKLKKKFLDLRFEKLLIFTINFFFNNLLCFLMKVNTKF